MYQDLYRDGYVGFLDLLGFKNKVVDAEKSEEGRKDLREALRIMAETLCDYPAICSRVTFFSDCIVLSSERTAAGLLQILESIAVLSFNMLQIDVLIRGGLAVGGIHHELDLIYGGALISANNLEKDALYPMTLIAEEVAEDASKYGYSSLPLMCEDRTGRRFVHYLLQFVEYSWEHRQLPGTVIMEDPAQRVAYFIGRRLNAQEERARSKAEWVRDYWNRTVASKGVFNAIDNAGPGVLASRGPTIIHRRLVG